MRWWLILLGAVTLIFWVAAKGDGTGSIEFGASRTFELPRLASPRAFDDAPAWQQVELSRMPKYYYQGITSDRLGNFYFDGVYSGLYRTDARLNEQQANEHAIPADVRDTEGFNHIGDITWDKAEGGRLLLPLECFYPKRGRNSNTCQTGAIGVANPRTLRWRYYVRLDRADITRVPWNEVSPDGELLWTSSGHMLLAYRASDINPENAGPRGRPIKPVRRIPGAVPQGGITGAAFYGDRLLVAGMDRTRTFNVWSVNPLDGSRNLELRRNIIGESEGLDVTPAFGGVLHWQILPYNPAGERPTYGEGHATLLHFLVIGRCANLFEGTPTADHLVGSGSGDKIHGGGGNDTLLGNGGADCLFGGAGDDVVIGGPGGDKLVGDAGRDAFVGGTGDDMIIANDGIGEPVACGPGNDLLIADEKDKASRCERVTR
jgi:RTX calcium-binding nonapeptide repeat (4 copies)